MGAQLVACPFCGLACDDLMLDGGAVDTRGCAKGAAGFARSAGVSEHSIAGRRVALAEAVDAAARLLAGAHLPLFTGLGADLAGVRALLALADRTGAVVDRWRSAAQQANLAVVERAGAFAATFGEIANRADVVVLLGRDPSRDYPRLFQRLLRNRTPLYRAASPWVAYIGPEGEVPGDAGVAARIPTETAALLDTLSTLAALVGGRSAGLAAAPRPLADLAQRLKAARYGALVWDAAAFAPGEAELAATLALRILRELNRTTRCVGLPLAGSDNAQGVAQALLWQAGWPTRLSFAAGAPAHDPWAFNAERLVEAGEIDALLWVGAISPMAPPPVPVPIVALVAGDTALAPAPQVAIRVGIPGLDHAGTVVRADTVIAVPLAAARPSALPSVAAVASSILERLGAAR